MKKEKTTQKSSDEGKYTNIPKNHLIIFGIYSVVTKKEECTFERLIKECFTLFPKVFGMSRYPQWPDTLKFDRDLRKLREQGLITGYLRISFSLTKFGERLAKETEEFLKKGIKKRTTYTTKRGADINWINYLKKSQSFQGFLKNGKKFSITEMEFRNLLRCTLETPPRIIKQNLLYSKNLAKEFKEKDLTKFLEVCSQKLNIK